MIFSYALLSGGLTESSTKEQVIILIFQLPDHILEVVNPDSSVPRTVKSLDDYSVDVNCDKEQYFQDLKVHKCIQSLVKLKTVLEGHLLL